MKTVDKIESLDYLLDDFNALNLSIGFVPTMGALHKGHLSLIEQAKKENDICVCSIFVNPTQFNNPDDLKKYPRQLNKDIHLLESVDCDVLFKPEVEEMYPEDDKDIEFNFGAIETVMEGADRPGHFQGVGIIVKKLFEIVKPHKAYFGKKDYQQLLIIKSLQRQYNLSPKIIGCDIVREKDGLAMSSRNQRLSHQQRELAPHIYSTLIAAKNLNRNSTPDDIKQFVSQQINSVKLMKLVYFEISDADSLMPIIDWKSNQKAMGFIVVNMDGIRLIDNIEL